MFLAASAGGAIEKSAAKSTDVVKKLIDRTDWLARRIRVTSSRFFLPSDLTLSNSGSRSIYEHWAKRIGGFPLTEPRPPASGDGWRLSIAWIPSSWTT